MLVVVYLATCLGGGRGLRIGRGPGTSQCMVTGIMLIYLYEDNSTAIDVQIRGLVKLVKLLRRSQLLN